MNRSLLPRLLLPGLIFVLLLTTVLLTEGNYGPHWDAPHYLVTVDRLASYLAARFGHDAHAPSLPPLADIEHYFPRGDRHPPLVKVLAGVTQFLFGESLGVLASARVSVAVLTALLGLAVYLFLQGPFGAWYATSTVLIWISMPRVLAHAHFLALDQPVAFFYVLSLIVFFHLHRTWFGLSGSDRLRKVALLAGAATIVLSLGFLTKHQSHFVIPVLMTWSAVEAWLDKSLSRRVFLQWVLLVLGIGTAAGLLFGAGWPALWTDTAERLREYVEFVTKHGQVPVIYFGTRYPPGSPPWHFSIVMWTVTVPVMTLVLFGLGCCLPVPNELRRLRRFLVFAAAGPFFFLSLPGVARFDGVRHLMPAAPFFAAVAALGLRETARKLAARVAPAFRTLDSRRWGAIFASAGLIASVFPCAANHPFQHVYYNRLIGGLRGAARLGMEADYLGVSVRSMYPTLNAMLRDGDILLTAGMNPQVFHPPLNRRWPRADKNDLLLPTLRVYSISIAEHLAAARGQGVLIINFRRSTDPAIWRKYVSDREPISTLKWDGVALCSAYPLSWEKGLPTQPIYSAGPVALLQVIQTAGSTQWQALWRCERKTLSDWGVCWEWRDESGRPIEGGTETQLVPVSATRFWFPGDIYRAWYPCTSDIHAASLYLAIQPGLQPDSAPDTLTSVQVQRE